MELYDTFDKSLYKLASANSLPGQDSFIGELAPETFAGFGGAVTIDVTKGIILGVGSSISNTSNVGLFSTGTLNLFSGGDGLDITLTASNAFDGPVASGGGSIELIAGDGAPTGEGPGGSIELTAGNALSGDWEGGIIRILAGTGHGDGHGGDIEIIAGDADAGGTFADGGTVEIAAGNGSGTGDGGAFLISSGDAGNGNSNVAGDIQLSAGSGAGGNSDGGNIYILAGAKTGSGAQGYIKISSGGAPSRRGILDLDSLSADRTYTFPNASGTIALTSDIPTTAHFVTTQAESGLSQEFNLGSLTTGLLKHTVSGGVSTPATAVAGTDYYNPGGTDVAIADGGTGQSTATAAFDALAPTTTQGDIIYHNGTDNVRLAKGTASQVLTMNSGATAPEWATPASSGGLPYTLRTWDLSNAAIILETDYGSGTTTPGIGGFAIDTTASANSGGKARFFASQNTSGAVFDGSPEVTMQLQVDLIPATGTAGSTGQIFIGFGDVTVAGTGITFTDTHVGFKLLTTGSTQYTLYGTHASGGTESVTSALTTVDAGEMLELCYKMNGSTSVDYYWSKNAGTWSSATNLTSNVPTTNVNSGIVAASNVNTTNRTRIYAQQVTFKR